ncbi:MAG: hypothetical protein ABWY25_04270 [Paenisporosarcina sp.]
MSLYESPGGETTVPSSSVTESYVNDPLVCTVLVKGVMCGHKAPTPRALKRHNTVEHTPKKRGRPKGSVNKSNPKPSPEAPRRMVLIFLAAKDGREIWTREDGSWYSVKKLDI